MLRLPVSFRTLLVWTFLLVALLPSLALVQMWWHLDQLALGAETRLADVDRWHAALRTLSEREEHLERSTRQWQALKDPAFQQLAQGFAADMTPALAQLAQVADPQLNRLLVDERQQLQLLNTGLSGGEGLPIEQLGAVFDHLTSNQVQIEKRLQWLGRDQQKNWADSLRQQRQQADRLALLSVSLALVLALLLGYMLLAPLGRLRQKIGRLAQGVRAQSWQVSGPTDVRDLAMALQRLDARLEQLEAEKASFFRQVSHELKTPLAAISEAAALLADEVVGSLTAAQHEIVAIQQSNTITLRDRVETLLRHDVARWLSQKVEFQRFSLDALLQQRMHDWQALMLRRDLHMDSQLEVDTMWGDAPKVATILDNLLINAIRFSPSGGTISLVSLRANGCVVIRVADQGPGVSLSDRAQIFDPFFCGAAPADESPGSGIGLTMARTFAQLMGGDVRLIATENPGACFELSWPESELAHEKNN
jgi:two-component system sensor histidine kinase GlrK